jgi:cytoskeletal protein CcmA (bactofilin family)
MFNNKPSKPAPPRPATVAPPVRPAVAAPPQQPIEPPIIRAKPQAAPSIIGKDLVLEGGVSGEGELHIDGLVRGDVRVSRLTIGETGRIEGTVAAELVEARGKVVGSITAKQIRLFATAFVDGDITHEQLAMETGASFQGRSLKFQRPAAPAQAPAPHAAPPPVDVIKINGGN